MKEHFWKFFFLTLLGIGFYGLYIYGWLGGFEYHRMLFHIIAHMFV